MKTIKLITLFALAAVVFQGCFLKTVHPLVAEKDAMLLDGLEGVWESHDQRWTFINDPANFPELLPLFETSEGDIEFDLFSEFEGYVILLENLDDNKADTTMFVGTVGKFSDNYFLDLYIIERTMNEVSESSRLSDLVGAHFFPVHTISKINVVDANLEIEFFQDSWIKKLIENNRIRIKHEIVDDGVLVTASTTELQKFVSKYGDDEDAFESPVKLIRN